jgi:hypothetical protein
MIDASLKDLEKTIAQKRSRHAMPTPPNKNCELAEKMINNQGFELDLD